MSLASRNQKPSLMAQMSERWTEHSLPAAPVIFFVSATFWTFDQNLDAGLFPPHRDGCLGGSWSISEAGEQSV